jgi:putative sigma-54 modulation protein
VHYRDHELFGAGAAADTFTALSEAVEKLEKQILKVRAKWRDTKRSPKQEPEGAPAAEAPARTRELKRTNPENPLTPEPAEAPAVFRVDHHDRRKPMTLDEAILEIDGRDYVVYRDADSDRVSVLIRRRDGNYDLIEA